MKTIDEIAQEYSCRKNLTKFDFPINEELLCALEEMALKEGVKIAQEWISVEKELPKDDSHDWYIFQNTFMCFAVKPEVLEIGVKEWVKTNSFTHWRPIERK